MEAKPTIFEFVSYKFEPAQKRIFFNYRQKFDGQKPINYTETLILPLAPNLAGLPEGLLEKVLEGVHLILGISYYKFYCSPNVKIPYRLSKTEADFWSAIYKKGLGEFFYRNKLDPKISPVFLFDKKAKPKPFALEKNNRCLVAVSGGKDSIVASELLKEQGFDITAVFTQAQRESEIVNKVMDVLGAKALKFTRHLDWQIHEKHKYDGHVPVSAMFAFLGVLYAVLYRYSYVVMANEHSSNFGNVKYKGLVVNHQWSKSSEFENMFREYMDGCVTKDIRYFSLLRPFYEIRIARMFCDYKKYFPYFSSCNKNFKINKDARLAEAPQGGGGWCGHCAKCAFAFVLFSAFLSKKELLGIFKKNLYEDESLLLLFKDILGLGKIKPFDCVGTFEESQTAFALGASKFKDSFIVRQIGARVRVKKNLAKDVFSAKQATNIPSQFRFSGMKSVLILGYGREGEVSKKYIKENFPRLKIGAADEKEGKNYLKKQLEYDIAVKTPGIKKELVSIPYTTATNLFFVKIKQLRNVTIGVTGSKGKSTTASLIFEILKEAGKSTEFLGNIGKPMLSGLLKRVTAGKIFVLELSSAQLDDLDFSPDIAVVTNLFPEHMDYHGNVENYYSAKKNIINFQRRTNSFIYTKEDKILSQWAKECSAKAIPGADKIPVEDSEIPLLGRHNRQNIKLAVSVAREFGISDEVIKTAIKNFKPLPHRLEFVGEFKGIKFYDDAISTTPESTIMAIETLKNVGTIFLGGQDRGYSFTQLEKIIKKYKIKNVVLFPDSGKRIRLSGLNVLKTKSMRSAVKFAYKYTELGKICLLSCASPSYSLWKNFEEKGEQFKSAVKKLK